LAPASMASRSAIRVRNMIQCSVEAWARRRMTGSRVAAGSESGLRRVGRCFRRRRLLSERHRRCHAVHAGARRRPHVLDEPASAIDDDMHQCLFVQIAVRVFPGGDPQPQESRVRSQRTRRGGGPAGCQGRRAVGDRFVRRRLLRGRLRWLGHALSRIRIDTGDGGAHRAFRSLAGVAVRAADTRQGRCAAGERQGNQAAVA
jgi:hypothetical protein